MRILSLLASCLCLFFVTTLEARADKRVALVIGNGAYKNVPTLPNPTDGVRLEQECVGFGCWHGRGFNGGGLARR
jgi:hypothetical protein